MTSEPLQGREVPPEDWSWFSDKDPPFHRKRCSPVLEKFHGQVFGNAKIARVFVPMCGKTLDMIYLADQGYEVVGVEFSKIGVESFFRENDLTYAETEVENEALVMYKAKEKDITIYQGDLFKVKPSICGYFDGSWDRGSYVAINVPTRNDYVDLMSQILKPSGRILMEAIDYDPTKHAGPPHYTTEENLQTHFGDKFDINVLEVIRGERQPSYFKVENVGYMVRVCMLTRK